MACMGREGWHVRTLFREEEISESPWVRNERTAPPAYDQRPRYYEESAPPGLKSCSLLEMGNHGWDTGCWGVCVHA